MTSRSLLEIYLESVGSSAINRLSRSRLSPHRSSFLSRSQMEEGSEEGYSITLPTVSSSHGWLHSVTTLAAIVSPGNYYHTHILHWLLLSNQINLLNQYLSIWRQTSLSQTYSGSFSFFTALSHTLCGRIDKSTRGAGVVPERDIGTSPVAVADEFDVVVGFQTAFDHLDEDLYLRLVIAGGSMKRRVGSGRGLEGPAKGGGVYPSLEEVDEGASSLEIAELQATADQITSVRFYLKVLDILENFGRNLSSVIIDIATSALALLKTLYTDALPNEKYSSLLSVLYTKLFKHQRAVGLGKEAFETIKELRDDATRKNCLRQLIISLCESPPQTGGTEKIINTDFGPFREEVISIIEGRARNVDITSQRYYDVIYAMHTKHEQHRRAAMAMYEEAMMLSSDHQLSGVPCLQRQARCLLASINSLSLCPSTDQWLVWSPKILPNMFAQELLASPATDAGRARSPGSAKRDSEGNIVEQQQQPESPSRSTSTLPLAPPSSQKNIIVDMKALRRRYHLVNARLKLLRFAPSTIPLSSAGGVGRSLMDGDEMVVSLSKAGLYDSAVAISKTSSTSLQPIFESLTKRCIQLSRSEFQHQQQNLDAWIHDTSFTVDTGPAMERAWNILEIYLKRFEPDSFQSPDDAAATDEYRSTTPSSSSTSTLLHRTVASQLLSSEFPLPTWLVHSYQKRNCAELVRVWLEYGQVTDATELCIDILKAAQGKLPGADRHHLDVDQLTTDGHVIHLPHNLFDILLAILQTNEQFYELNEKLVGELNSYQALVENVSENMIQLKRLQKITGARNTISAVQ